jgi:hypothetical protein
VNEPFEIEELDTSNYSEKNYYLTLENNEENISRKNSR